MAISIEDSINKENTEKTHERKPTFKINPLILNRWSPRSMSGVYFESFYMLNLLCCMIIVNHFL